MCSYIVEGRYVIGCLHFPQSNWQPLPPWQANTLTSTLRKVWLVLNFLGSSNEDAHIRHVTVCAYNKKLFHLLSAKWIIPSRIQQFITESGLKPQGKVSTHHLSESCDEKSWFGEREQSSSSPLDKCTHCGQTLLNLNNHYKILV